MLEHVSSERETLAEVYRVLKVQGRLFLFAPNRLYPFESHGVDLISGKKISPKVPFIPYIPVWLHKKLGIQPWARNYFYFDIVADLKKLGFKICHLEMVPQTFEGISGSPLKLGKPFNFLLRKIVMNISKIPIINKFTCVSFYIVAEK